MDPSKYSFYFSVLLSFAIYINIYLLICNHPNFYRESSSLTLSAGAKRALQARRVLRENSNQLHIDFSNYFWCQLLGSAVSSFNWTSSSLQIWLISISYSHIWTSKIQIINDYVHYKYIADTIWTDIQHQTPNLCTLSKRNRVMSHTLHFLASVIFIPQCNSIHCIWHSHVLMRIKVKLLRSRKNV